MQAQHDRCEDTHNESDGVEDGAKDVDDGGAQEQSSKCDDEECDRADDDRADHGTDELACSFECKSECVFSRCVSALSELDRGGSGDCASGDGEDRDQWDTHQK